MTLLEQLVAYGVSRGVLTGDGVDTYRDFMPERPDDVVVFAEYSGDACTPFSSIVQRSVQIRVRATSAVSARTKAVQLFSIFCPESEDRRIDFTSTYWGQVYVRQSPYKIKQDANDRVVYGFNMGITTNILE